MTLLLLAADPELLDLARLLLTAAREVPRRRRRFGPVEAGAGFGPAWAWCPAEEYETPHRFDVGARCCLTCKTTTTKLEEKACE